jgi:phenylpyruvate tautomerase PptA (4-oxalocrotonate tautomerase family)
MPFADAYIPEGALSPAAERALVAELTDLLIEHEGVDPNNPVTRHMAWVFVHRPDVYVAGRPPNTPRYRFICQVPEGQYDAERRAALTAGITEAVARAENGAFPNPEIRVAVFACEVPEGWWGGVGRTLGLADIYELAWPPWPGMDGDPRETAARVLAERRRANAERLLGSVDEHVAS